ncbi:ComF family protein [Salinisphaera sp. P385]|uniref:ComF family protein n=1 Tax=Spectribacter acetivorans TaxID=3075603 RepID=A0ABU3B9X6_9GAMM|nr:ComF family protein [Salinisphaera sp. P385]MDT0619268.1 ComF family protein [Salinisphaera sp. P385]
MWVNSWLQCAQSLAYPTHCLLCGAPGQPARDLCPGCDRDLPRLGDLCTTCALPLPGATATRCARCLQAPPPQAAAVAALDYIAPVDWLVTRLKFNRQLSHGQLLAALLAERLAATGTGVDMLVPVPLHPRRRRERGFNQAAEIAAGLRRRLRLPVRPDLAMRRRDTGHQADLPARERAANMRGAFRVPAAAAGCRVAIIDDVITTGHTVAELAGTLVAAGAERVEVWAPARAPAPRGRQ